MEDLVIKGQTYQNVPGFKATNTNGDVVEFIKPEGTLAISASGTHDVTEYESVSVPSGAASVQSEAMTANPTISVNSNTGKITATVSANKQITPSVSPGFVTSGTSGQLSVSGAAEHQLTTQSGVTVTPSSVEQIVALGGTFLTGPVKVAAVPSASGVSF